MKWKKDIIFINQVHTLMIFLFSSFVFLYFKVPTGIWWDNFDRTIDRLSGGSMINTTLGITFQ